MERLFSISVKVVVSILFQKARKMLNNERGEANYFSTVVFIFIAVLLLAFIIDLFSIISTKQELDHAADQMVKQIQLSGGVNGETDELFEFLSSQIEGAENISYSIDATYTSSRPSGICIKRRYRNMAIKTLYTAVGRFERRTNGCNRSCPIILLGGQEYMADMQEMVIWSMLNWRILRWDDIAQEYEKLATASGYCTERSWEDCTNRLLTRGLLVSGSGETEYDALYDLLGSLSIIPTSGPFFLRLASFVKLTLLAHVPVSAARKLFQKDKRTKYEVLVMRLAGQALLSTAEIIKCIDKNISRLPNECALLDSLYGDETTTSDNIASMVKISQSSKPVTLAVTNLYLRQQIIFERV